MRETHLAGRTLAARCLVCLLVMVVLGCGMGDSDAKAGRLRIGITVYDMTSFITQGKEGISRYAALHNLRVLWNSANNDVSTQAAQVDQLVNAEVDAIMILPVQGDSLQPQLKAAEKAGIPVITVNMSLTSSTGVVSSVLPDDFAAGAEEMRTMANYLRGAGNIVVLQGPLGSSSELNRTRGINSVLSQFPKIKVLAMDTANWRRDEAVNKTKNWLTGFGDRIHGIVAENDDMGLGAVQALAEARLRLPVVGIDGIQDGLEAVKHGDFIGSMLQHGRVEMTTGLAVIHRYLKGEQVAARYTYTMPAVTPANVDEYLANVAYDKNAFLDRLPALIDKNLTTGNIANERQ